jgi:hypothetical protein
MEGVLIKLLVSRCFKYFFFVFAFKITIYFLLWLENTVNIRTLTVVLFFFSRPPLPTPDFPFQCRGL